MDGIIVNKNLHEYQQEESKPAPTLTDDEEELFYSA
jgi:hypothetical protein